MTPDGAEWNTAALGPDKRRLSIDLYKRLKNEYAATGLAHFGQGKWYPGEPLPRWSLNCFWRRDGEPIWQNPQLLADETASSGASHDTAQRFLRAVANAPRPVTQPLCLQPMRMLSTTCGRSNGYRPT